MDIDPDALARHDPPREDDDDLDDDLDDEDLYAGLPWNHHARFDGHPGLVWYSTVRKVRGDQLQIGDWLDTLDHRGARTIYGIWAGEATAEDLADTMGSLDGPKADSQVRTVMFSFGDTETVHTDDVYDVVDPDSQVTPDGTPVFVPPREEAP